jgi:hypothetical protein
MAVSIGSSTEQREHLESLLDKLMFHDLVTFRGYPGILALLRWSQFRPEALPLRSSLVFLSQSTVPVGLGIEGWIWTGVDLPE